MNATFEEVIEAFWAIKYEPYDNTYVPKNDRSPELIRNHMKRFQQKLIFSPVQTPLSEEEKTKRNEQLAKERLAEKEQEKTQLTVDWQNYLKHCSDNGLDPKDEDNMGSKWIHLSSTW